MIARTARLAAHTRWPVRIISGAALMVLLGIAPLAVRTYLADPWTLTRIAGLMVLLGGVYWASFVRSKPAAIATVAIGLTGVALIAIVPPLMDQVRFAQERPELERAIAAAGRGGQRACSSVTRQCIVDRDSPLRVAIRWTGSGRGRDRAWRGVCYDPSGLIAQARACGRSHPCTPEQLAAATLFRGTMVSASRIADGWYVCTAT